jgi:hypothetical protein
MAFAVKYRTEFTDILGLNWKVEIEEDSYAGAVTDMQCSGNPLTIDFLAASDDLYDNSIKGSKADLTIESTNFQWIDLYSTEDLRLRMSIYYNSTLYWRGYVITNNYSEAYNTPKFSVTISASDGLGYLKNYLYKYKTVTEDDTYYQDRILESQIVLDILGKLGITSFTEFVNIYEESMVSTTADSPMDQIRIDVDVFRDMYCYEVLDEILKKYNAVIRIIAGQPTIYRPVELAGATVYGRIFTAAATKTSTTLTPSQYISRKGTLTDLRDTNGGTLMIQAPAKKVTIYQDYGYKESWIDNWELRGNTLDEVTYKFKDWTYTGGGIMPVIQQLKGESDGVVFPSGTSGPGANPIMYQSFGNYAVSTSDVFIIEFEYFFASLIDAQDVGFNIRIKSDNSSHYLYDYDDYEAKWNGSADYIDYTEAVGAAEVTEWRTFKRTITGVPTSGSYTIGLYSGTTSVSNALWGIKNIRFYCTSDKLSIKRTPKPSWFEYFWFGKLNAEARERSKHPREIDYKDVQEIVIKEHVVTNAINGLEIGYNCKLGDVTDANVDNVIEQLAGSLMTNVRTLLQVVHTVTLSADSPDGTIDITCDGLTKTATYISDLPTTALVFAAANNTAWALQGIGVTSSGNDIIFTGTAGQELDGDTEVTNLTGGLNGSVGLTQPNSYSDVIAYSTDWNTRGGSESKELLSIICDELTNQFSRPKHFLSLPIMENNRFSKTPHVDILGNFQDSLNQIGGNNRKFVFNKGTANIRDREWNIDLIEII